MALLNLKKSDYAQNTARLAIKDSEGNPILDSKGNPATLIVLPVESKEWKKAVLFKEEGDRNIVVGREKDSPEKADNRRITLFSSIVTDWENVELETDGIVTPFSKEKLTLLLKESPDDIIGQIDRFISDKSHFVKKTTLTA